MALLVLVSVSNITNALEIVSRKEQLGKIRAIYSRFEFEFFLANQEIVNEKLLIP